MSQYFRAGDRVLWNPSNRVADLFLKLADAVVVIAEVPNGIEGTGADEYEIDLVVFEAFVDVLTRLYLSSSHPIMRSLLEGFLATALVLVDRAGGTVSALSELPSLDLRDISVGLDGIRQVGDPSHLQDLMGEHAQAMPR